MDQDEVRRAVLKYLQSFHVDTNYWQVYGYSSPSGQDNFHTLHLKNGKGQTIWALLKEPNEVDVTLS